jgi:hypothetical protein
MTTLRITARSRNEDLFVEIGAKDTTRFDGFEFGGTAEVSMWSRYGNTPLAEVSMSSIGSHDPAQARRRVDAYAAGTILAEVLNGYAEDRQEGEDWSGFAAALNEQEIEFTAFDREMKDTILDLLAS